MARTMLIGGSNAHTLLDRWGDQLDEFTVETPFGTSHRIRRHRLGGTEYFVLFRHGTKGYEVTAPFVNYRANIFAAKKLGVTRIVSWTGPGGISKDYEIGDLVMPSDIIDYTRNRPTTFFEGRGIGFIRVNPCFCPGTRGVLAEAVGRTGITLHRSGVYACTEGPRLETAAEIRMMAAAGADMVGMTLAPEAFLARELEICYASLCYITNYAESDELPFVPGELFEGTLPAGKKALVDRAIAALPDILAGVLTMPDDDGCICRTSLLRYKRTGRLSQKFEEWF